MLPLAGWARMRSYDDTLIAPIHAIIALHRDVGYTIFRLLLPWLLLQSMSM